MLAVDGFASFLVIQYLTNLTFTSWCFISPLAICITRDICCAVQEEAVIAPEGYSFTDVVIGSGFGSRSLEFRGSHTSGGSKGGREGRTPPPSASKFFQFHAVFWENSAKMCVHAPSLEGSRPPLGEILDPSLHTQLLLLHKVIEDYT